MTHLMERCILVIRTALPSKISAGKSDVELKKQSSCQVHIVNKSDQYVDFKVKTTSPKKYCVRPNLGIIKPKDTCDFTVTMQAQRTEPLDMQCKDKFLIQSTLVPFGTTEDDITSDMVTNLRGAEQM
nr:vesicle-associated protein 2-2 [Arachis hypogaea]